MRTQLTHQESASSNWISSITYRSEAARPPSSSDLHDLVSRAKLKNRSFGITGMLLCNDGRFLQTLEGPPESVDQIWSSIQRDPRHGSIEVLSQHIVPARLFSGWDMQLYDRSSHRAGQSPSLGTSLLALTEHVNAISRFALAGDDGKLNAVIGDLIAEGWVAETLVTHLLEPTARMMGDAWLADDCSELELTIGLSMLQLAGHTIHSRPTADSVRKSRFSILLATAPGESHMLGSSLLGDIFANAGWTVGMSFPANNEELAKQLHSQKPDAVDIALSDALTRHGALEKLRETIEKSRRASPDDVMVVSVGGRLFAEAAAAAGSVGADHARTSAAGTSVRLALLVEERRAKMSQKRDL